jgi:hypothetical protein
MIMDKRGVVLDFHIERDEKEIVLEVHGTVSFGIRGVYNAPPERCFPDEPDDVTVNAMLLNGNPWSGELTIDEEDELVQMLLDAAYDNDDDYRGADYNDGDDYEPTEYKLDNE